MSAGGDGQCQVREARALRSALARLGAGERLPRLDDLAPALREHIHALDRLLARAEAAPDRDLAPRPDRHARPAHAVLVGVDRLAAIRHLGSDLAEAITSSLGQRIRNELPHAQLRRTGRSTIEFVFDAEPDAARGALERLHGALEARIELEGQIFDLPVAIGFARAEPGAEVDDALTEAAEHALARARAEHRKLAEFDEATRALRTDNLSLMRDLRAALDTDSTYLCYQPKLDARSGRIAAAEALVRWRHPERGMVPPDVFIGLAEQTGEIRHLTERVLNRAIADQAAMRAAGAPMEISVNVSGALFCDDRFAAWALERVAEAVDPIGFEITETAVIQDPEKAIAHMRRFVEAGVPMAIDDYGAGLSSLAYLKQLPAEELKIDRSFIQSLTSSHREPLIVRSTIELAHALDMKVTAEGVETPAARALLTVMGCDLIQGYEVAEPLRLDAFIAFLKGYDPRTAKAPGGLLAGALGPA